MIEHPTTPGYQNNCPDCASLRRELAEAMEEIARQAKLLEKYRELEGACRAIQNVDGQCGTWDAAGYLKQRETIDAILSELTAMEKGGTE
jgi:chromosome segregation ATPase